jgi:hypothetical protein
VPDARSIAEHRAELDADWSAMLRLQLQELPPVDGFWNEMPRIFGWLAGAMAEVAPSPQPLSAGEQVIRAGIGELGGLGGRTATLETIRFAASNRLRVELQYINELGEASSPIIEPYSLRRTSEGHVLLHAERPDGRGHRSYRLERIRSARITNQTFAPRFAIELTPSGYQAIPESSSRASMTSRSSRTTRRRPRRSPASVRYVYECGLCRKRFVRQRQNPSLKPHKDKQGWPCSARTGWLVDTRL